MPFYGMTASALKLLTWGQVNIGFLLLSLHCCCPQSAFLLQRIQLVSVEYRNSPLKIKGYKGEKKEEVVTKAFKHRR